MQRTAGGRRWEEQDVMRILVGASLLLVQGLRAKHPTNERRPLEGTRAYALYSQVRRADGR